MDLRIGAMRQSTLEAISLIIERLDRIQPRTFTGKQDAIKIWVNYLGKFTGGLKEKFYRIGH